MSWDVDASHHFEHVLISMYGQAVADLMQDCTAAMHFCLDKHKDYHRARYQLARVLQAQGRLGEAIEQLRALFSSGKRSFCINMWEISDNNAETKVQANPSLPSTITHC
jgi:hypothetical protein